jgi:hypothetical protein
MVTVIHRAALDLVNSFLSVQDMINVSRVDKAHRQNGAYSRPAIVQRLNQELLDVDFEFGLPDGTLRKLTMIPQTCIARRKALRILTSQKDDGDTLTLYTNAWHCRAVRMFLEKRLFVRSRSELPEMSVAEESRRIDGADDMEQERGRRFKNIFSISNYKKPVGVHRVDLKDTPQGDDVVQTDHNDDFCFMDGFEVTAPHFKHIKLISVLGHPHEVIKRLEFPVMQVTVNGAGIDALDPSTFEDAFSKTLRMTKASHADVIKFTNSIKETTVQDIDAYRHNLLQRMTKYELRGYHTHRVESYLIEYRRVAQAIKLYYAAYKRDRDARNKAAKAALAARKGLPKKRRLDEA